MSNYYSEIKGHTIHAFLANIETELKSIKALADIPADDMEVIMRVEYILENFKMALESCDKKLISMILLDETSNVLTTLQQNLTNYSNSMNISYITTNIVAVLDKILTSTAQLNLVKSKQSLQGIAGAIAKNDRTINMYLNELSGKIDDGKEELKQLSISIDNKSVDLDKKYQDSSDKIDSQVLRNDGALLSFQNLIAEAQTEFQQQTQNIKLSFEEDKKIYFDKVEVVIESFQTKFKDYEKKVEEIVGVLNYSAFSHKYKEVADNAKKRANFWHGVTMVSIIALCVFALIAFSSTNQDTSWVKLTAKIFATTTLATGAAYAARQASKQEKVERYTRKIEMELIAIDPFILSLPEDTRISIKEEISRRIFGNANSMEISEKEDLPIFLDKLTKKDMALIFSVLEKIMKS